MLKSLEPRHLQTLSAEMPVQRTSHNPENQSACGYGAGSTPWGRGAVLGLVLYSSDPASPQPTGVFWTLSSGSCQPEKGHAQEGLFLV